MTRDITKCQNKNNDDAKARAIPQVLSKTVKLKILVTSIFTLISQNVYYLSQSKFQLLSHPVFVVC